MVEAPTPPSAMPRGARERISVYLIHFGQPEWCASAVRTLLRSRRVFPDVTVVDNGGGGQPVAALLPPEARVLTMARNVGYAGAANAALRDVVARHPGAEFCVIGSHDLHLQEDALAILVEAARRNPAFGVLAPVLTAPFESSGGAWWGTGGCHDLPIGGIEGVVERDWVSGTCLFVRVECGRAIGGFDERFGSYAEDVDFGLRARDAGWKVGVVADATAFGLGSGSSVAPALIEANIALLVAKRSGRMRALPLLGRSALAALRCTCGALLPWRSAERRAMSVRFLRLHAAAFVRAAGKLRGMSAPQTPAPIEVPQR